MDPVKCIVYTVQCTCTMYSVHYAIYVLLFCVLQYHLLALFYRSCTVETESNIVNVTLGL